MSGSIEDDIREAMKEVDGESQTPAVESAAPAPAPEVEAAPEEVPAPEAPASDGPNRDPSGRFAPKDATKAAAAPAAVKPTPAKLTPTQTPSPKPGEAAQTPAPATGATETVKAPQALKPFTRENWDKVPKPLQDDIVRRERETAMALQEVAPIRKKAELADAWQQTVAPYEALFRSEGVDPLQGVGSLVQTYAALRGPNAPLVVANIIRSLNIPVDALAQALDNPQAAPQRVAQQEFRDPRLDQLLEREKQRTQERVQQELNEFLSTEPEFIQDVAPIVRSLMNANPNMGFKDAYERAIWSDPDIRGILQQREAVEAAKAAQASTQQARAAASSVRTQPTGVQSAPQSDSVMDDVRAAMAELSGR